MKTLLFSILIPIFLSCGGGGGEGGEEAAATPASETTSNENTIETKLSSVETLRNNPIDLCTEYSGEACYFKGGQKIVFEDGSIWIWGSWAHAYSVTGDTDVDFHQASMIVPKNPKQSFYGIQLTAYMARGIGYRSAFLVYKVSTKTISVVYDIDNDGLESTDSVLFSITPTKLE